MDFEDKINKSLNLVGTQLRRHCQNYRLVFIPDETLGDGVFRDAVSAAVDEFERRISAVLTGGGEVSSREG